MNATKKTRVVIIEPSPVVSQGIKSLLEENSTELSVIGVFCDLHAFQKSKLDSTIDFILINPAIINFYKQFNVKDLFTDYPDIIIAAIQYGYIDSETLNSFDGVLDIYDDGVRIVKKLKSFTNIYNNQQSGNNGDNIDLSEREKEILVAVAKGMTNKEIADKHFISIHTVVSHRKNITRKTGIKTVSGLTIYAMFNNLISQEDLQ
jgi:Response regulator containing a CheY-like receiver domain and an HTH DNA-binding domain